MARGMHDVTKRVKAASCIAKANRFRRVREDVPDGTRTGVAEVRADAWKGKTVAMS